MSPHPIPSASVRIVAALLLILDGCGGNQSSSTPQADDILGGAFNTDRPTPPVARVSFTNAAGAKVTMQAFAGEVVVFFAPSTSVNSASSIIHGLGGTILTQAPNLGYYLVSVPAGSEGATIAGLRKNPSVIDALPDAPDDPLAGPGGTAEAAVAMAACGVPVSADAFGDGRYVTIPATIGSILIDHFALPTDHGFIVAAADEEQVVGAAPGTTGCAKFRINLSRGTGSSYLTFAMFRAIAGSRLTSPDAPIIINLSQGPSAPRGFDLDIFCGNPSNLPARCEGSSADELHLGWESYTSELLQAVAALPPVMRQNVIVTKSMGNSHMELSRPLADIRATPALRDVLANQFILVGASVDTIPQRRNDFPPAGTSPCCVYTNYVRNPNCDDDVVNYTGLLGNRFGTSYSAPRVAAIAETLLRNVKGLTPAAAVRAIKSSSIKNNCVLEYPAALKEATGVFSFAGDVHATIGTISDCGATYTWTMSGRLSLAYTVDSFGNVSGVSPSSGSLQERDSATVVCPPGVNCTWNAIDQFATGPISGIPSNLHAALTNKDITFTFDGVPSKNQLKGKAVERHAFNIRDDRGCNVDRTLEFSIPDITMDPQ